MSFFSGFLMKSQDTILLLRLDKILIVEKPAGFLFSYVNMTLLHFLSLLSSFFWVYFYTLNDEKSFINNRRRRLKTKDNEKWRKKGMDGTNSFLFYCWWEQKWRASCFAIPSSSFQFNACKNWFFLKKLYPPSRKKEEFNKIQLIRA